MSCRYSKSVGATHYNTSAKLNKGLDEVFIHLTKSMCILLVYEVKD